MDRQIVAKEFCYAAGLLLFWALVPLTLTATDFVQLNAKNWDEFSPKGKEVDAIYGDYVLRNDQLIVVIARPSPLRNANLTIRDVGGFVLDLTERNQSNDQLGCFRPLGQRFHFHSEKKLQVSVDGKPVPIRKGSGQKIKITLVSSNVSQGEKASIEYSLEEGASWLEINHRILKNGLPVRRKKFTDHLRADRTFKFSLAGEKPVFFANDDWFRQCYGICAPSSNLSRGGTGAQRAGTPLGAFRACLLYTSPSPRDRG